MLYKEYDEYSGAGGYDYPSKSKMWLKITEVIQMEAPEPRFPGANGKRVTCLPSSTSENLGFYTARAA
jgi:hypothetical protein